MKRKMIIVVLSICMVLILCSCGKSEKAQAVDDKIQSIGTVTLESGDLISEIENDYIKLSDKEKEQLEYYQSFVAIKESYEKLLSEKAAEEAAEEAREKEKKEMAAEIEKLISDKKTKEAKEKIDKIEDSELKKEMQNKLSEKCYKGIDLYRFNEVVSIKSDRSKEDTDEGDQYFSYYYYSIWSDIKSAFDDYNLYLNANCDKTDSQNSLATSYHYELDGKEVTILLFDVSVKGEYMLQIMYDK